MRRNKLILAFSLLLLAFLLVYPVAAVASASPGSTTSIMSFPVTQAITGLTASTVYDIVCTSDGNSTVSFTSDSDGKASLTVSPPDTGANTYAIGLTGAGGPDVITFTITNMDIMVYIVPLFTLMIIFAILGAVTKMMNFG